MLTRLFFVPKNVPYKTTAAMQNTRAILISIIKPLLDLPKALILRKWNTYFREYNMKEVSSYEKWLHHRSRLKEQDVCVPWIMKQICNLFRFGLISFFGRHDIHWFLWPIIHLIVLRKGQSPPCNCMITIFILWILYALNLV